MSFKIVHNPEGATVGEPTDPGEDSLAAIDALNSIVDGSSPTSATEAEALTNLSGNITSEAQGIYDGLNTLLGSAPTSTRLDHIHSFVDSATLPSSVTVLTDWTTRFADGPFGEGDPAIWAATGAVYRYSSALRGGLGDWVRSEVYDSSFVAFAHVDGDEANSTEMLANGWDSVTITGAGAVNYNQSGKFEMDLTGTGAADRSYLQKAIASSTSSTGWACGLYTMATFPLVGTVYARLWTFFDGTYSARFQYSYSHNKVDWSSDALALLNTQFGQDSDGRFASNTDEKHLAFSVAPITSGSPGLVRIWIDHAIEPYWVGERDQGTATSANVIQVGVFEFSNGGTDAITLQIRDWSSGGIL